MIDLPHEVVETCGSFYQDLFSIGNATRVLSGGDRMHRRYPDRQGQPNGHWRVAAPHNLDATYA
jgi:hypothetical protein